MWRTPLRLRLTRQIFVCGAIVASLAAAAPVSANLFTHILREAGDAGGKSATHGFSHLGPVGKAAAHLKSISNAPKGALAAHATPEGHWQFVNREGQVYTAGTADEMKRALPTLSPEVVGAGETKLSLYVSEDSIFQNRAALDQLPHDAQLHVVTESGAYSLMRTGAGSDTVLKAQIKPNLIVNLSERYLFDETISYLGRTLNKSNMRTIALEPGAAKRVSAAPKLDPVTKTPLVDQLDPAHLASALGTLRGQTALIVGRVENGVLFATPSKGAEFSRSIDELVTAARENDVNLVVLHSDASRQPGGRNWLWQQIEIGGMSDAANTATFGDFLEALGARRGGFQLSASNDGLGRVHLSVAPSDTSASVINDATSLLGETVGTVTGEIVTRSADLYGRDEAGQREIDERLIPGIPTYVQIPYFVALVCGLIGWPVARGWWNRMWLRITSRDVPMERQGRGGRLLRALPREAGFVLLFLPVVGVPAFTWSVSVQVWNSVTAPFRWIHRKFLRRTV